MCTDSVLWFRVVAKVLLSSLSFLGGSEKVIRLLLGCCKCVVVIGQ